MNFEEKALSYHESEPRGKIGTKITKAVSSQEDLSIAYSPGVAGPCRKIAENQEDSFRYTGRANLVGVITNGSAVLGLGDIGPYASKPVMEGKAMLFKKFANIDVFDIEVDAADPDEFIATVKALEPTFGGINLEDIKAPECFYVEEKLRDMMNIPVFHDDQHGTAIIAAAAFINALEITGRDIAETKVVFSGAGAAAIACAGLLINLGIKEDNLLICDSKGVIHDDRDAGNKYKAQFSRKTEARSLTDALKDADAFIGVSVAGILKPAMIETMAKDPIIFALANPDPEIDPDEAKRIRPDAIIATGRSDHPNQVNNVLGFPFIFRGALDVQAKTINEDMKRAAVYAIAKLAKKDVPESVMAAYKDQDRYSFGRDYLIPKPVDPRVLMHVAPAVAQAAMDSGVARKDIDIKSYKEEIEKILGPTKRIVRKFRNDIENYRLKTDRKPNILLTHGHDHRVLGAAADIANEGDLDITLLGNKDLIKEKSKELGFQEFVDKITVIDPHDFEDLEKYTEDFFELRQRKGISHSLAEEAMRNINYFGAMLLRNKRVDGMLNGLVEPYATSVRPLLEVFGTQQGKVLAGVQIITIENKLYFFSDCTVNVEPTAEQLAQIAIQTAEFAKNYTDETLRVAMLSFSSFGSNKHPKTKVIRKACEILESSQRDFVFDGDIQADVALNEGLQKKEFPFSRLKGQANILIFPDLMAANICYKLLANLSEAKSTGPILMGTSAPAHVLERGAKVEEIINLAYFTGSQATKVGP